MKLACGRGEGQGGCRGHRDVASTAFGAEKFTEVRFAALSGAGANLSRRSWEGAAAGVDVYTFGRWQLARRILWAVSKVFFTRKPSHPSASNTLGLRRGQETNQTPQIHAPRRPSDGSLAGRTP